MSKRAKRRTARLQVDRSTKMETLEDRVVMSADPLGGLLSQHGFAGPDLDAPAMSHHGMGGSMSSAIVETAPVHDPGADFWFNGFDETGGGLLDHHDEGLGERIEQTLNDAHGMTGQDEVLSKYGFDGAGQTVVVIDTGIAYSHYALGGGKGDGYQVVGGWDFTENDSDFYDDGPEGGHGTHVAGIIGAQGDGIHSGVATGVDLVGLRVFDDAGNGYFTWVEQALQWTLNNIDTYDSPITAINLSLGTDWNSDSVPGWTTLEDDFAALEAAGVFISVSAGNSYQSYNENGVSYPAASDYVVPVMSVDNNGSLSYFSQRADYAIAAPGRGITSTVPDYAANDGDTIDDDWLSMSGTSMAAPYVAGASVLVREAMEFNGYTGITQDDIFDHMMSTADTFYDSASSTNYKRLNLEAAIDAIMPADDYGSSVDTAHNLGTLNASESAPLSVVSGAITTLDDVDYFSFTAGVTGEVTFTAGGVTHNLDADWSGFGGTGWSESGGDAYVMQVSAGQTYTVALATGDGLGFYDLSIDVESTFAFVEWGAVSTQETREALSVSGEQWYRVTAGQAGYFTAEALPQSGSATVAIYDAEQNLLASADGSGRVDYVVADGQELLLRVTGTSADFDLRMTNALSVADGVATLNGTSAADAVSFVGGSSESVVTLNGVEYTIDNAALSQLEVNTAGGSDTLAITGAGSLDFALSGVESVVDNDATASALESSLGFAEGFSYLNWGGWGEKWLLSASAGWHFITPDGSLYDWDSNNDLSTSQKIAQLSAEHFNDTGLLTEAGASGASGLAARQNASTLDERFGFYKHSSGYFEDWAGFGEKWIAADGNKWYIVTTEGDVHLWQGKSTLGDNALVASFDASYFDDPTKLHDTDIAAWSAMDTVSSLDASLGLQSVYSSFLNWGGWNEKWIRTADSQWCFITESGALYQWESGGLAGSELLGVVGSLFYENTDWLINASVGGSQQAIGGQAISADQAAAVVVTDTQSGSITADVSGMRADAARASVAAEAIGAVFAEADAADGHTEDDAWYNADESDRVGDPNEASDAALATLTDEDGYFASAF